MSGNKKKSVALSSVFASFFLTLIKFVVGILTGSMGIISEAAHSFLDLGAASLTYMAVRVSDKPADSEHHYGHGKVESVSAMIETGLLFLTSFWIVYEAVKRLIHGGSEIEVTWYAFAVIIVSIIVDFSRSRALSKVAKETGSQALEADALHFSSDILSSLVVLIGLVFVLFGVNFADSIAAIGVAIFVLVAGCKLGKRTFDVLVDTVPEGVTEKIVEVASVVPGVLGVEKIRARSAGVMLFVDMQVIVSRTLSLEKTQKLLKDVESKVEEKFSEVDLSVRAKPISLDNESITERLYAVALNMGVSIHDISIHFSKHDKNINFDVEMDPNLSVEASHEIVTSLENEIKKELGGDVSVTAHVEPLNQTIVKCEDVSEAEFGKIKKVFDDVMDEVSLVKDIHNIQVRKVGDEYFVTLHCSFDNSLSLEEAHVVASKMGFLAKGKMPKIKKTVVHIEPVT